VPENVLRNNGDYGQSLPPFTPLFLECDEQGRILWMNAQARERLGEATHLADTFSASVHLSHLLAACESNETVSGIFRRRSRPPIPVELTCVMRGTGRLLLAVEVRERASDQMAPMGDPLAALQSRTLDNYFRLLRVQQALDGRVDRGRRNPGVIISEQLERERARLARELHTGVGQSLSAIKVHVELVESKAPALPAEIQEYLDRIAQLARDAAAEVSAVSRRLHPLDWQALSLAEALRNLWNKSGIPERFQGSLNISLPSEPSHPVRVALYRIVQESISNVIRHSGATRLSLTLVGSAERISLRIEDNGTGFDPREQSQSGGLGLRAMRDQVRNLDGDLRLLSGPHGTTLEVTIPLEPGDE
jgi:signal transduction histidine kinase